MRRTLHRTAEDRRDSAPGPGPTRPQEGLPPTPKDSVGRGSVKSRFLGNGSKFIWVADVYLLLRREVYTWPLVWERTKFGRLAFLWRLLPPKTRQRGCRRREQQRGYRLRWCPRGGSRRGRYCSRPRPPRADRGAGVPPARLSPKTLSFPRQVARFYWLALEVTYCNPPYKILGFTLGARPERRSGGGASRAWERCWNSQILSSSAGPYAAGQIIIKKCRSERKCH